MQKIEALKKDYLRSFSASVSTQTEPLPSDFIISFIFVISITLLFFALEKNVRHWFILPAMACGLLTGPDIIRWLRGACDAFDPKALMSFIIFYGWSIAPLLHGFWNVSDDRLNFTGDFRHWLGIATTLNALGLIFFQLAQKWAFKQTSGVEKKWQLIRSRIVPALLFFGFIGFCAQVVFYIRFFRLGTGNLSPLQASQGSGWLLMLGDPVPLLLLTGLILRSRVSTKERNWFLITIVLFFSGILQLVWSGLRGSRSAFLGAMLRMVGVVHFFWRRFRPIHLLIGVIVLIPFLYLYGIYFKSTEGGLRALESKRLRARLEKTTGRTIEGTLLGDLSRCDVQARIANGIMEKNYHLRYGRTYLVALSMLIPPYLKDIVWDELDRRLSGKEVAFYELYTGKARTVWSWVDHNAAFGSSRVYGLTGEAMLNFGVAGVPVSWTVFGLFMGWLRRKFYSLQPEDTRLAFWPCIIIPVMGFPIGDLDNFLFGLLRGGVVIFLCTLFWSKRSSKD